MATEDPTTAIRRKTEIAQTTAMSEPLGAETCQTDLNKNTRALVSALVLAWMAPEMRSARKRLAARPRRGGVIEGVDELPTSCRLREDMKIWSDCFGPGRPG